MGINGVMIDSREPDWVQKLTFGGVPTSVTYLEHGDLMVACHDGSVLYVERKTPDDFLSSLRDGRLFPQLAFLTDKTKWAYLVITGDLARGPKDSVITDRGQTGWSWNAIQGALLTIQEMGVFVSFAANDIDYEACILRLGQRDRKPDLLLAPAKFPKILSIQESIVAALPGIGTERLQLVMDYVGGSPAWAIIALTDPDTQIPGIPHSTKVKIRNALKLADKTQLVLTTNDRGEEILQTVRSD